VGLLGGMVFLLARSIRSEGPARTAYLSLFLLLLAWLSHRVAFGFPVDLPAVWQPCPAVVFHVSAFAALILSLLSLAEGPQTREHQPGAVAAALATLVGFPELTRGSW
jgi:hypothetical protein